MSEQKQTHHTVIYYSDDGLFVISLPMEIANTSKSQEVLMAISGKDPRFNPYTRTSAEENKDFIDNVVQTIYSWNKLYGVELGTKTSSFTFGGEYM